MAKETGVLSQIVGTPTTLIFKSDFSWPLFYAEREIQQYSKEYVSSEKEYLRLSMEVFKWKKGKHPKYANSNPLWRLAVGATVEEEKPVEEYSEAEIDEMDSSLAWKCFSYCNNALDLLPLMKHEAGNARIFSDELHPLFLALIIQGMEKTADNLIPMLIASQQLASYKVASLVKAHA